MTDVLHTVIDLRDDAAEQAAQGAQGAPDLGAPSLGAPSLGAALEALLLIAEEPLDSAVLGAACDAPVDLIEGTLADLQRQYLEQGRGFTLRAVAGGWRFYTSEACADLITRWVTDGRQSRLSPAALETLAVVAYRQPVSRARISAIRGVSVDAVMRTLTARGLVAEAGTDHTTGAHLYATTDHFLERMGLQTLDQLPPIAHLLPDPRDVTDHDEAHG